MYVTEHTVKKHISSILGKLQLKDRVQAALFAAAHGMDHHATANTTTGVLQFTFGNGQGKSGGDYDYGLQKNSTYTCYDETNNRGLFKVTNYSNDTIKLSIEENETSADIDFDLMSAITRGGSTTYVGWRDTSEIGSGKSEAKLYDESGGVPTTKHCLKPGETVQIGVRINIGNATVGGHNFNLNVKAEVVAPVA